MILPVWITDLPRIENWDYHYNDLIKQHSEHVYKTNLEGATLNNFVIDDPAGVWDELYQQFFNKSVELFNGLAVSSSNSRKCWLYTVNNNHYFQGIHNHRNTAMINGVYYFSVPKSAYHEGALTFFDRDHNDLWTYKPREQDMIIFPGFLNHQPSQSKTDQYRFAINMEIQCDWPLAWGDKPADYS
jgi:hypothetical protein